MNIAIDFDGSVVTHEYPRVGKDIGAIPVLKELIANGHSLILFTMRSGRTLDMATDWFEDNEITLYGIQENPTQKFWTTSKKCYADLYVDDAALGAPLKFDESISSKPFIDWEKAREMLVELGLLTNN